MMWGVTYIEVSKYSAIDEWIENANKSAILIAFSVTFDCFECLDCILFVNIELHRSLIQFDLILKPDFALNAVDLFLFDVLFQLIQPELEVDAVIYNLYSS